MNHLTEPELRNLIRVSKWMESKLRGTAQANSNLQIGNNPFAAVFGPPQWVQYQQAVTQDLELAWAKLKLQQDEDFAESVIENILNDSNEEI